LIKEISFEKLVKADLFVDALYKGGTPGNTGDDPISKLNGCGNQGGFRYVGSTTEGVKLCALYSSLTDKDWPDALDPVSGVFVYYGDNKSPGYDLHDTRRKGNLILRDAFNTLHSGQREKVPSFFIFTRGTSGRDVFFRGLAVPGARGHGSREDLIAIWKTKGDRRFQNYRSIFTILDEPRITRNWIDDIRLGNKFSVNAPTSWLEWIKRAEYRPLLAPRAVTHRSKQQQLPEHGLKRDILETIVNYFKKHPGGEYAFENCAAEIAVLMDSNITRYDLTRPWRDGGRDALGKYRIGNPQNAIEVEFALEAKCKSFESGSGIGETSRLIARLRHRQFGIFVTTSYVGDQAYKEIIEDAHPVIIVSGAGIAQILIDAGHTSVDSIEKWLNKSFPCG
jgi:hypothetical protein